MSARRLRATAVYAGSNQEKREKSIWTVNVFKEIHGSNFNMRYQEADWRALRLATDAAVKTVMSVWTGYRTARHRGIQPRSRHA